MDSQQQKTRKTPDISLVTRDNAWIEGAALAQLETTARLKGMQLAVGLPDLHPGKGATFIVLKLFNPVVQAYPALARFLALDQRIPRERQT